MRADWWEDEPAPSFQLGTISQLTDTRRKVVNRPIGFRLTEEQWKAFEGVK